MKTSDFYRIEVGVFCRQSVTSLRNESKSFYLQYQFRIINPALFPMKTFRLLCYTLCVATMTICYSQGIGINEDGSEPAASAIVDISSSNKGLLAPRMTTSQRNNITAAQGLIVFDTDENSYYQFDGGDWVVFEITAAGSVAGDVPDAPALGDKYFDEANDLMYVYTTGGWAALTTTSTVDSPYGTIDLVFGSSSGHTIEIESWNEDPTLYDGYVVLINTIDDFADLSTNEEAYASPSYIGEGAQPVYNGSSAASITITLLEESKIFYFKMVPYSTVSGNVVYTNSQPSVFVTTTACIHTSGTTTSTDEFEARNDDDDYQAYSETVSSQVCFSIDFDTDLITISSNQWPDHHMGSTIVSGRFPTAYVVATETVRELAYKPTYDESIGITYVYDETGSPSPSNPNFYQFGIASNGVEYHPMGVEPWDVLDSDLEATGEENWEWQARVVFEGDVNLDAYGGHTTSDGNYHYHGDIVSLVNEDGTDHSQIYGFAADGFPIYYKYGYEDPDPASLDTTIIELTSSYQLRSGSRSTHPNVSSGEVAGQDYPSGDYDGTYIQDYEYVEGLGDLDECNGRYGVTPEFPDGTYYYVISDGFPRVSNCFVGNPDDDFIIGK